MTKEGEVDALQETRTESPAGQDNSTDGNASFLRAARAGNLEKVLEYLKGSIDINTSNANGLNALHLASKEGHVNVVTELLKRGANVDAATKKGNTALHIASLAGQEEIVKILVQQGASVNVQSQNGFTPLYMAAQENHDSVVKFLLANGANQSLATEDGFTPLAVALQQGHDKVVAVLLENDTRGKVRLPALHIAAKKDDCKAAALLLQNDHNPDVTSKSGFTPLHIAAHYGNENIANLLLQRGADVNFAAKHNITPMHVAAKWGKTNMVQLLVDKKANVEAKTRDGLTPLHCAARSGHDQVVDHLLDKGAPIVAKTKNGLAPLHMAAQGDHVDSARILLYHKAPVDDVTVDYLTALHVAAHCGHVRVAKLLLDRKADPNARALNGFTPLHIACKKNRIKVVELLLKHGASIEATTESGLTPLHVASFMGCMNIVIYLIQHGSNPDVPTVRGETPLHLAARANQTDIIRILLRNGAHVDARAREQQTPLHIAARLGNSDIVALLLQHGAAVDATTKDMYTALHIAAKEGQEEVASVLLEHGASLTATTKKGFTPLHLAAKYGNMKVARLLLQRDAPVDAQGKNGVTPLHVAAHYDNQNVALLLLDKGASPHATAKNGYTPLHIAAKKNQMDIATTLLEYGAKSNAESKAGFTPSHLAAQEGHTDMSTLLLEHHANVNAKAKNGLTPLHLCAQEDKVNVAAILVKNGAEIDSKTKAGYTPLHVACHFGQMNMVRFLLQHGADVNATTAVGYTPLHQASQQGHTQIVNLLLENRASPNAVTNQGQTALSIAQRLGYISVVETLKIVTETTVTTTTTTITEEKYRVVAPETMQETFMSDSEDEGGEDTMLGDQSYRYLTVDEMKSLGDDSLPIIDPTRDERMEMHLVKDSLLSAAAPSADDDYYSPQPSGYAQFSGNYAPDNIDISRSPVHAGQKLTQFHSKLKWKTFLVSFMVDARGGAMRGCRHSGVRVIIPPRKAPMPMRITCRYLKKEKLTHPPPLMEGEACASRILEVGPTGAKFLGPVIIEVPHFASLRGKEREITILRSDDGETWREHTLEASEEAVQEVLNESFDGEGKELSALEDLNTNRITRILTTDFPQYFAIITRVRQEVHAIGPEGGMVSSTVVPQVQAVFPEGALTKKIKVGLQAQPVAADLVAKLLGNRVAVSPVVTVEPRRRKFHKPITLTIPVPQAAARGMINQYNGETPTLRLLCSITGGTTRAQWEDVTGSTPLTFVNDCVSFTTTVSARFWLMDCRNISEAMKMATELYREAIHVPFMAKFVVFAKRHDPVEAKLRVFCMTDDKEDKTLENQEHFMEVAKSRDVEVLENKPQYVEFAGNLIPITKSGEQLALNFHAFRENRLPFIVREKDPNQEPIGRIAFMREPKVGRGDPPQNPICNLNITLPDLSKPDSSPVEQEVLTLEKKYVYLKEMGLSKPETIHKADLRLSDIAVLLGNDWVMLALQLDVPESDINLIKTEYPDDINQQAMVMLRLWMQLAGNKATGNTLEKALRKINREDIVNQCIFNVELVTDDVEKAVAKVHLDQSGFDTLKEELGPSREASLRRDISLDVSYDEQDIMKEAESAEETGSETGSIADQQKTARTDLIDTDVKNPKDQSKLPSAPPAEKPRQRPDVPPRPKIERQSPAKPPRGRGVASKAQPEKRLSSEASSPVIEESIIPQVEMPTAVDAWTELMTDMPTPPQSPPKKAKIAPKVPERPKIIGEIAKTSPPIEPQQPTKADLDREFEKMLAQMDPVSEEMITAKPVDPTGLDTWVAFLKDEPYPEEAVPKSEAELMAELEASILPLSGDWLVEDKGAAKPGEPAPPTYIDDAVLAEIHRKMIEEGGMTKCEMEPPPRKKKQQLQQGSKDPFNAAEMMFGPDPVRTSTPIGAKSTPTVFPELDVEGADGDPARLAESEMWTSQELDRSTPEVVERIASDGEEKKPKSQPTVEEKEWTETTPTGLIKRKEKVIKYTTDGKADQDGDKTEAEKEDSQTSPGATESKEESEVGIIEDSVPFAQTKDFFQKLADGQTMITEKTAAEKKQEMKKMMSAEISPPQPAHGEIIEDMVPFAERVEFFRRSLEESALAKDVREVATAQVKPKVPERPSLSSPPKSPPARPPPPSHREDEEMSPISPKTPPPRPTSPPQVQMVSPDKKTSPPVPPPRRGKQLPLKSSPQEFGVEEISPFSPDLETPKDTPEMTSKSDEQKMIMVTERVAEAVTTLASTLEEKERKRALEPPMQTEDIPPEPIEQLEEKISTLLTMVQEDELQLQEEQTSPPPVPPKDKWSEVESTVEESFRETELMESELMEEEEKLMLRKDDDKLVKLPEVEAVPSISETSADEGKAVKAEIKLLVKTTEPGKEAIEIRSIREFVEGEPKQEVTKIFSGILTSTTTVPAKTTSTIDDDDGHVEVAAAAKMDAETVGELSDTEPQLDHTQEERISPSSITIPSFKQTKSELESPLSKPSPLEPPTIAREQQVSPAVDFPMHLPCDHQVRVGVSPTELTIASPLVSESRMQIAEGHFRAKEDIAHIEHVGSFESSDRSDTDTTQTEVTVAPGKKDLVEQDKMDESEICMAELDLLDSTDVRTVIESTSIITSSQTESKVPEGHLPQLAFENRAFAGIDEIDVIAEEHEIIPAKDVSPFEVPRSEFTMAMDSREKELEKSTDTELEQKRPIIDEPEGTLLTEKSEKISIVEPDDSFHQDREIDHQIEEDFKVESADEVVPHSFTSSIEHSFEHSEKIVEVIQSKVTRTEETCITDKLESFERSIECESIPETDVEVEDKDFPSVFPQEPDSEKEMESTVEKKSVAEILPQTIPSLQTALLHSPEPVVWEVSVQQQAIRGISESADDIPPSKQILYEKDEEDDENIMHSLVTEEVKQTSPFEYSHIKTVTTSSAGKVVSEVIEKTVVSQDTLLTDFLEGSKLTFSRPPLEHIPSEISEEDLVERYDLSPERDFKDELQLEGETILEQPEVIQQQRDELTDDKNVEEEIVEKSESQSVQKQIQSSIIVSEKVIRTVDAVIGLTKEELDAADKKEDSSVPLEKVLDSGPISSTDSEKVIFEERESVIEIMTKQIQEDKKIIASVDQAIEIVNIAEESTSEMKIDQDLKDSEIVTKETTEKVVRKSGIPVRKRHPPGRKDDSKDIASSDSDRDSHAAAIKIPSKEKRKSDGELGSSSGESPFYSFDIDSGQTSGGTPSVGSRPCSSDVEGLVGAAPSSSDYDTCATTSQEYRTARSSLSPSSRESMQSIDSESSGHLGSFEVSSETSETLMPSATENGRDAETPVIDDEKYFATAALREPYDAEIPESVLRGEQSFIPPDFPLELRSDLLQGEETDEPGSPFEIVLESELADMGNGFTSGVATSVDLLREELSSPLQTLSPEVRTSDTDDTSTYHSASDGKSTTQWNLAHSEEFLPGYSHIRSAMYRQESGAYMPGDKVDDFSPSHDSHFSDEDHVEEQVSSTLSGTSCHSAVVTRQETSSTHTESISRADTSLTTRTTTRSTVTTVCSVLTQDDSNQDEPVLYHQTNGPVEVEYVPEYDANEDQQPHRSLQTSDPTVDKEDEQSKPKKKASKSRCKEEKDDETKEEDESEGHDGERDLGDMQESEVLFGEQTYDYPRLVTGAEEERGDSEDELSGTESEHNALQEGRQETKSQPQEVPPAQIPASSSSRTSSSFPQSAETEEDNFPPELDRPESELKDLDVSHSLAESLYSRSDSELRPYSELQFSDDRPDSELTGMMRHSVDGKEASDEIERPSSPVPKDEYRIHEESVEISSSIKASVKQLEEDYGVPSAIASRVVESSGQEKTVRETIDSEEELGRGRKNLDIPDITVTQCLAPTRDKSSDGEDLKSTPLEQPEITPSTESSEKTTDSASSQEYILDKSDTQTKKPVVKEEEKVEVLLDETDEGKKREMLPDVCTVPKEPISLQQLPPELVKDDDNQSSVSPTTEQKLTGEPFEEVEKGQKESPELYKLSEGGLHTREWLATQFEEKSESVSVTNEYQMEYDKDFNQQNDLYLREEGLSDILEEGEEEKGDREVSSSCTRESTRSTPEFDVFPGRKGFSKSGEHDDVSMNSLQEFERLEAEIIHSGDRRSSLGSQDSLNGVKKVNSRSGLGDDVSVSSLQEFETLENLCDTQDEKPEAAVKEEELAHLSEIEEGHESQVSESDGHETLSEHDPEDDTDADDYEKRLFEIDEIIRQAQSNVEMFETDKVMSESADKSKSQQDSGSGASAEATESSMLDKTPSPTEGDADSLEGEDSRSGPLEQSLPSPIDSLIRQQRYELDRVSLAQHVLASRTFSSESSPHQSRGHSSASTTTQYDVESLREREYDLEEQGDCDQDSLQGDQEDLEQTSSEITSKQLDSDSLQDDDKMDTDLLKLEVGAVGFLKDYDCESLGKGRGDVMVSSTDSLEPSSSTATHATYHYETDSIMSSSFASVQTSGEESTMMSSTDTLDTEQRTYHQSHSDDRFLDNLDNTDRAQTIMTDSEGNALTTVDSGIQDDVNFASTVKRTVMMEPEVRTITFAGPDAEEQMKEFIEKFQPGEDVVEMETTDEQGNVHTVRTVQHRVVMQPQMTTVQFSGRDADEQLQQFMNKAREDFQSTEEEETSETSDEHGNVRRVIRRRIIQPETKTVTFSGPDARKQMEEFMKQTLPNYDPVNTNRETESKDISGNVTRVLRHSVISRTQAEGGASTPSSRDSLDSLSSDSPKHHSHITIDSLQQSPASSSPMTSAQHIVSPTHSSSHSSHSEDCYCGPEADASILSDPSGTHTRDGKDQFAAGDSPTRVTSRRHVRTVTTVDPDGTEHTVTVEMDDGEDGELSKDVAATLEKLMTSDQKP